ncbi:unnamed protein product [Closterium sp. NIES-53]
MASMCKKDAAGEETKLMNGRRPYEAFRHDPRLAPTAPEPEAKETTAALLLSDCCRATAAERLLRSDCCGATAAERLLPNDCCT